MSNSSVRDDGAPPRGTSNASPHADTYGASVLIVDDSALIRVAATDAIERQGFQTTAAGDATSALAAFRQRIPDLVLLDIVMPGMDGIEACQEIRRLRCGSDVPVLIMTALTDPDMIRRAYEAGATDMITKPVDWDLMALRVRFLIRAHRTMQASRSRDAFLDVLSREIRAPMTAILGYVDVILEERVSPIERREFLEIIRRNGHELVTLLDDVLDISRLEAGEMTVDAMSFSPRRLVGEVASLLRVRAEEKGTPLEVQWDEQIPESIQNDPTRLRQILINLIGNAVKFTDSGSVCVTGRCVSDGMLEVEVVDSGVGMEPERLERLFDPFEQGDSSAARRFGGAGLGLPISRRLARVLGGDLEATSAAGEGTTFTLRIATDLNPPNAEPSVERGANGAGRLSGRVLVAEDCRDTRQLIETLLQRQGLTVQAVEDGERAVAAVRADLERSDPPSLVLMDLGMPRLDGNAATRELREAGFDGAVIALTAHVKEEDRRACMAAGCDDFLAKPVGREQLLAKVREHLGKRHA